KVYLGLLLGGFLATQSISAQEPIKTPLEIADGHYKHYEFVEAAKVYQKLIRSAKTDNYIYLQLDDWMFTW
ncbi:hypothetical protein, partial [Myroides sp. C20-1]|uniref:hypothetical protein n=1 Tax=Myroides sp. C20-1 TaxID=3400534 RepID=UPI003D2F5A47